ncbi:MAG: leucine-rich repeat protein [Rikenellaceae bacterium]
MKKIILSIMAVATTFASCHKSEEAVTGAANTSSEVVFTSTISTRATDTAWDAGDEIGVFMYEADDTTPYSDSDNVLYTTSGGESGTFTSLNPLRYAEDKVDFIAYHPYTTNYSDNVITLNTANQSSTEKVKAQDFMVASAQYCDEENAPSLSFTRKMSKISITVTRKESRADAVLSNISLSNVITDGTFTISNSSVTGRENSSATAGETASDISLFFNEASNIIEAIIIPQDLSSKLIAMIDNELFGVTLSGTFVENTQYNYNLLVGGDKVDFTEGTISQWAQEDSLDMSTTKVEYTAAEIDANNIPEFDTWTITDEGEITSSLMTGVKSALSAAYNSGREISIAMPNATSIGGYAFQNCSSLTSIVLPEATSIELSAFYGCSNLSSIELPKVASIGKSAFQNCSSLSSIVLPEVTSIEYRSFYSCSSLTSIVLTKATSIGEYAFYNCSNLSSIESTEVESIGQYAFSSCSNLSSIVLNEVTSIGNSAFSGCSGLTSIELPEVTSIENSAFSGCSGLTSIELNKAISIGNSAFYKCSGLTDIYLSEATSIGNSAFYNCSKLSSIVLNKVESIGEWAFYNCSSLTSIKLNKVTSIGERAFSSCSSLTDIELPETTSIGSSAFSSCSKLSDIVLPEATSIGQAAFYDCYSLSSIELPKATSIGHVVFLGCSSLTSIVLPEATSIGQYAFASCIKLSYIELPKAISIEEYAFSGCEALTTLKLTAESEIECGTNLLSDANDPSNITLYISITNDNVTNLTDGTYSFKEIVYND